MGFENLNMYDRVSDIRLLIISRILFHLKTLPLVPLPCKQGRGGNILNLTALPIVLWYSYFH